MSNETTPSEPRLLQLTTDIAVAYLGRNAASASDLPDILSKVHNALKSLGHAAEPIVTEIREPAVPIRKSVTPDYLICLEDGKKLKMLKRHLQTAYGMSPQEYRAKWRLPDAYPMVAPNYAATRSALAKTFGLGRRAADPLPEPIPVPARKGRKPKAAA
jgi:predicted transcriptional regulator